MCVHDQDYYSSCQVTTPTPTEKYADSHAYVHGQNYNSCQVTTPTPTEKYADSHVCECMTPVPISVFFLSLIVFSFTV